MSWHKEIWTYLIVTLVAVLIWAWAASETREQRTISSASIRFAIASEPNRWLIDPPTVSPSIVVEGTKLSVQELANVLRKPLKIDVSTTPPRRTENLADLLRVHEDVLKTGATIVSTEPATVDLALDGVDADTARVTAVLPLVTVEGDVTVSPPEVSVSMPHSLRQRMGSDLRVEAAVPATQLEQLERGVPQSVDVRLRLPEAYANEPNVTIRPANVRLNFTIRSRIRETKVDSARVLIESAPENMDAYVVEVEPKVLRGLTVEADADLSRRIEAGEVPVVAIVHLRSSEIEAMIDHKPIAYFMAHVPSPSGLAYAKLDVKPGTAMPVINLKITRRVATQQQ